MYPNLLHVELQPPERTIREEPSADPLAHKSESELFEEFFAQVNGVPLSDEQRIMLDEVIRTVRDKEEGGA